MIHLNTSLAPIKPNSKKHCLYTGYSNIPRKPDTVFSIHCFNFTCTYRKTYLKKTIKIFITIASILILLPPLSMAMNDHDKTNPNESGKEGDIEELANIEKTDPEIWPIIKCLILSNESSQEQTPCYKQCNTFWTNVKERDGDIGTWLCCPCIAAAVACIFPSANFCGTCVEIFNGITCRKAPPLIVKRLENLFQKHPLLQQILAIRHPEIFTEPEENQDVNSINFQKIIDQKQNLGHPTQYQLNLIDFARRHRLQLQPISADHNCFRNAALPPGQRGDQNLISDLIASMESALNNARTHLAPQSDQHDDHDNEAECPISRNEQSSFFTNLFMNMQFTEDCINEMGETNRNREHADIRLANFLPLINHRPVLVVQPHPEAGNQGAVFSYIVNTTGSLCYEGSESYSSYLPQATIIIHNGDNHFLTATRQPGTEAACMPTTSTATTSSL